MRAPGYVAGFDSATSFVRAGARFLDGKDMPAAGQPRVLEPILRRANRLPRSVRRTLYIRGSGNEAVRPRTIRRIRAERVAEWMVDLHTERDYPAAFVGSPSGAITHLAAAMGAPWLPQTFMIPLRQPQVAPDDPWAGIAESLEPARALLANNPDLQLHLMHDPNQDRFSLERMQYFRVKWRALPEAYRDFLVRTLPEGATLFIVECERSWPTTLVEDRFIFQFGAVGGATEREFYMGGPRVAEHLESQGKEIRRWTPPPADAERPEAEWGFVPTIRDDLMALARERGWRVRRIVFDEPEHPSPMVADLHRAWYRRRGIEPRRLAVQSFLLSEPHWALRTGSVPFWMTFNMEPSAAWLEDYLDSCEPYDEIHLGLFAHGAGAVGLPPRERWDAILERGRSRGAYLGVDADEHPLDLAVYARFHDAMKALPSRHPMPASLTVEALDELLAEGPDHPAVRIEEGGPAMDPDDDPASAVTQGSRLPGG